MSELDLQSRNLSKYTILQLYSDVQVPSVKSQRFIFAKPLQILNIYTQSKVIAFLFVNILVSSVELQIHSHNLSKYQI